jgi:murein DD-endopeptidase MepM/ murein hydrolase activator NlpD
MDRKASFKIQARHKVNETTKFRTALFKILPAIATTIKKRIVSRMFWGRSSFYKNISHTLMIGITLTLALSGIASRIAVANNESNFTAGNTLIGSADLLQQGGSIETVLISSVQGLNSIDHTVADGENLSQIASKYNVTEDTIRWFNPDLISPFSNTIQSGWTLKIPASEGQPINGVLYTVRAGQSIDDVIKITSQSNNESNRSNIIEFNNLTEPYTVSSGQKLFIPDGNLSTTDIRVAGIPRGVFTNPLADPACSGYGFSRGFAFYHNGVDLAKGSGCPIQAIAAGSVTYAGWSSAGEGYNVKINHGGGIESFYYHGNGNFGVKVGDRVTQGQYIMSMGSTGNSTGVHLHFALVKNGVFVDPAPYVPY